MYIQIRMQIYNCKICAKSQLNFQPYDLYCFLEYLKGTQQPIFGYNWLHMITNSHVVGSSQ